MSMGRIFAIAGKGGVGKTTISALLIEYLSKKSGEVLLAVDADPNYNLGDRLGVDVEKTIGDLREELQKSSDDASEISKHEQLAYNLRLATKEGSGFDLITMGRSEGKGCYCYINSILRDYLSEAIDQYPYVVIDNEAGMEHISRLTCKKMDILIVVTDATAIGFKTAKRILDLALSLDLEIGMTVLVVNKVSQEVPCELIPDGFSAKYFIPFDETIETLTTDGAPLKLDINNSGYKAIKEMADNVLIHCRKKKL